MFSLLLKDLISDFYSIFKKVESLDTIEPIATSVLYQFMTIKNLFQIDLHIMCTSRTYLYVNF